MYSDKIQRVRREAQETNVANKIIDMLDKLRLSANENSPRRWIWELLQNAKDVTNSSGRVKVKVRFDEEKGFLEFSHNGKPFTTTQLVYLIEQVSTKERNEGNLEAEKKSGKFGTGFLTTHLLSEKLVVSGILADEEVQLRSFNVHLDRSGKNKDEIIKAIQASYEELENSTLLPQNEVFDENSTNTIFQYVLDKEGMKVAKAGMEDLNVSIPYVLSLMTEIEEIIIEPRGIVYKNSEQINCGLENSTVFRISRLHNEVSEDEFVLLLTEENVTVAITLEQLGNRMKIKQYDPNQPKLFCDFPLVGTSDFPFPIIVNSSRFNPTEPRDGVFLTNNRNEKVEENKSIMQKACYLYKQLLEYASQKSWSGIYNITCIRQYSSKEWFFKEWVNENVVNVCKEHIKHCPMVDTSSGNRVALYDVFDGEQAFIITAADEESRNGLWTLANKLYPDVIPCKQDYHCWYSSLWNECRNFSLEELTKQLQQIGNITSLASELKLGSVEEWLNEYYLLMVNNKKSWADIKEGVYAVVPNQNGVFCKCTELYKDADIDEEYKSILQLLKVDCRKRLMYKGIKIEELIDCQTYNNDDIIDEIESELKCADKETEKMIYSKLLILYDNEHENYSKQIDIIKFANSIWQLLPKRKCVQYISEKMLEQSIKYITTRIADTISEQQEMLAFEKIINLNEEENAITWLADFIEYVIKSGYDNLLNRKTYPILPNQNGKFVSKDDLFLDDEVDEILKDLTFCSGNDIRNELLSREIDLELPSNREKHSEDLAPYITQYVKENHNQDISRNERFRNFLKKLLIWIDGNPEKAEKIFPEICENKHWLYDDKEIVINMKKAEEYDNLLEKYNISSPDKLEQILMQTHNGNNIGDGKEELTEEILIQSGICSEEELENALESAVFADNFTHESEHIDFKFDYVTQILERSKNNILKYLETQNGYDLNDIIELDKTIFLIKKNSEEIFLIARPSDYNQVILYYDSEKDILDYEKDWELWVENGVDQPQKITFGKILKLTGINKIPLRKVR
ncbi:sacsin N-terminal ATP-binding-like domain-containing protein [Clostridium estertheticum]|uniref:sacsin N-terminal ATP-binding-like domain-containing protein n=1 Tax=Clostridium estertheticum TaxID=238834 RepID=UPI001CF51341|nr:ATP-binding protein [Clostridium estertheticum]MCB2356417.1 ATP-binding protein [Clostridium estertheticum]WAG39638.1 ATP-binding protein [Clostridium estertheticum]